MICVPSTSAGGRGRCGSAMECIKWSEEFSLLLYATDTTAGNQGSALDPGGVAPSTPRAVGRWVAQRTLCRPNGSWGDDSGKTVRGRAEARWQASPPEAFPSREPFKRR